MAGWWSRILGGARKPERDVPLDPGVANTRDEYVGRVAGQDVGYAGETGAERRAEADRDDD